MAAHGPAHLVADMAHLGRVAAEDVAGRLRAAAQRLIEGVEARDMEAAQPRGERRDGLGRQVEIDGADHARPMDQPVVAAVAGEPPRRGEQAPGALMGGLRGDERLGQRCRLGGIALADEMAHIRQRQHAALARGAREQSIGARHVAGLACRDGLDQREKEMIPMLPAQHGDERIDCIVAVGLAELAQAGGDKHEIVPGMADGGGQELLESGDRAGLREQLRHDDMAFDPAGMALEKRADRMQGAIRIALLEFADSVDQLLIAHDFGSDAVHGIERAANILARCDGGAQGRSLGRAELRGELYASRSNGDTRVHGTRNDQPARLFNAW